MAGLSMTIGLSFPSVLTRLLRSPWSCTIGPTGKGKLSEPPLRVSGSLASSRL